MNNIPTKRSAFNELLPGVHEAALFLRGNRKAAARIGRISPDFIAAARTKLGFGQTLFAHAIGSGLDTSPMDRLAKNAPRGRRATSQSRLKICSSSNWGRQFPRPHSGTLTVVIMPKSKSPHKVGEELNRQFNQELSAARSYLALSIWCDVRNLKGFGRFFVKQAAEERLHAERILKHMTDRGLTAEVAALPAPKQDFTTLLEVAQQAQAQEHANTLGVNAVYEAALAAKDGPAQVLMHWFIGEQVEEEAWSTEMVERVQAASCSGGMSDLDRHIERYLAEEVREVPDEK